MSAPAIPTLFDATGMTIPPSIVPATPSSDPAVAAYGTKIEVLSAASPEAFTVINGIGDIAGPNVQLGEIETTSHSTGIPHKTFMPTLIDDGDLSFPCYFNPSDPTHSLYSPFGLENLLQNRAVTKFRITDPTLRTREIRGFVKQLNETFPVQGICQRAVTIRISGAPVDVSAEVTLVPTEDLTETAAGSAKTIAVTSASTQAWIAVSNVSWIVITTGGTPTVGDGSVGYTVSASTAPTPARTGVITIGNKTFTVTQAAGV
jgi:hypothetical protein